MTITKQQLVDKYNEVYAADNGVNKTFVQLTKDEKVEALLQFVTAISGGDASAANQTAVQANPGSDATKAIAIQGITGGKSLPVTGTFWQATQPVSAVSLPLPTDAATSVLQTTANTSLGSINTKIPALGQALAAASTPVVLPAAQITALTPPTSVGLTGTLPPGLTYESTATITRAADTTIYTASAPNFDVYGSLFELENIGVAGEGIFLSYFEISLNLSDVPQGMTSFAVHLYPTVPTTIADNSIWTIGSDPVLDPIGFNVSMSLAKGGGKVVGAVRDLNQLFILTSTSLWGYLVTNGAIAPAANSEEGTIRARSFAP
jgi:hypothetical protein